ncbi:MAG TPA: hypothetical protein VLZ76_07305 [Lysobacter sp.]|nr:hypothetical protein [Lysobacter sp.]
MNPSVAESVAASHAVEPFEVRLEEVLRYVVAVGAVLVVLLPDARGSSELIGWLPLWLLGMPSVAWWAVHRSSREGHSPRRGASGVRRHPHPHPQARRRMHGQPRRAVPRVA